MKDSGADSNPIFDSPDKATVKHEADGGPGLGTPAKTPVSRIAVYTQIVRRFAGKAKPKQQDVPVPIPMYGVTGKYASSLYVIAVRGSVLEPVEQELKSILTSADQNEVFSEFLKDPLVTKDARMEAIQGLFGKESDFSDVTKNFMGTCP